MSILLGYQILEEFKNGRIYIDPFDEKNLGPNSYDVRLNDTLVTYVECEIIDINGHKVVKKKNNNFEFLDCRKENKVYKLKIPDEGLVIVPEILFLGSTIEKAGSDYYVPMYEGRSSMARLGIQSHISAGFGDLGFKSNWTLEIIVTHPVKIYKGMRIGQVYFHQVEEEIREKHLVNNGLYNGKYTDQNEPQFSKSYLDFENVKDKLNEIVSNNLNNKIRGLEK